MTFLHASTSYKKKGNWFAYMFSPLKRVWGGRGGVGVGGINTQYRCLVSFVRSVQTWSINRRHWNKHFPLSNATLWGRKAVCVCVGTGYVYAWIYLCVCVCACGGVGFLNNPYWLSSATLWGRKAASVCAGTGYVYVWIHLSKCTSNA